MLISDGGWISETCKAISKKAVDQADMELRLGMFVADKLLDYYKPKVKPQIPMALDKYRALNKDQKYKFNGDNPDWRSNPTVAEYLVAESGIECENQSNVWWLSNFMKYDIGEERKDKIQSVLDLYSTDIRRHLTQRPTADPEAEAVRKQFKGQVFYAE